MRILNSRILSKQNSNEPFSSYTYAIFLDYGGKICGVKQMAADKTGVYICKCSTNIAEKVDVDALVKEFGEMDGVAVAKSHALLCSDDGKRFLEEEIRNEGLTRLVVAACSPREHERTFRGVCERAGMNPFLMQMVNIREQCAWMTDDPAQATAKARSMTRAALARVALQEPLDAPALDANTDALVIGAGVAGMIAAQQLAKSGRKVFLVEKTPWIGGMVVRYEDVFPNLECAPCMLEPIMDEVLHDENIEVLTNSEVADVRGFLGNFDITIKKKARHVVPDACFGCAVCYEACPVSAPNEYDEGLGRRHAIYVPFAGALPNVPAIDENLCLRFKGEDCNLCAESCGFGAVTFDDADETVERTAGAVIIATGAGTYDVSTAAALGYGRLPGVITTLELERIISSTGPTEGKVLMAKDQPPQRVAFVHCAGSRGEHACNYCSEICCLTALKLGHLLKKKCPDAQTAHFYADWCLPGKRGQALYDKIAAEGAEFFHISGPGMVKVAPANGGSLEVSALAAGGDMVKEVFDMVVLSTAIVPGADTAPLSQMFQVDLDDHGFFKEEHGSVKAVSTNMEGVFVAGSAGGPGDIRAATTSGKAAAGEILAALVPGRKLELEAATALIDDSLCTGCRICNSMCPYKAISFDDEKNVSKVNEVLCRGCGTCVSACPGRAASGRHFTSEQICAEIAGGLS